MGRKAFKNAAEPLEPLQSCRAESGSAALEPTEVEIRQRAQEIYLTRNGTPGDALADWLQAEQELRARRVER